MAAQLIHPNTETTFRVVINTSLAGWGYLAALMLLKEWEEKEYYFSCYWLLYGIRLNWPEMATCYSKKALADLETDFKSKGRGEDVFNEHIASVPERKKQMQDFIENHWSFMRY